MMISGRFPRPVFKFKKGTSVYPYEGLSLGFKPLKGPNKITIGVLAEEKVRKRVEKFIYNLVDGGRKFQGMERLFDVNLEVVWRFIKDIKNVGYAPGDLAGCDVVVVPLPSNMRLPDSVDYYIPLKQEFALLGIPTQMADYSTIKNLAENRYVLFNFALNIYGKAGGVGWGLADKMENYAYLGVDVGGGYTVVSILVNLNSPVISWKIEYNPGVEISVFAERPLLSALLEAEKSTGGKLDGFIVYQDGRAHWSEVEAVRNVYEEARARNILTSDSFYAFLEVRKRITPRFIRLAKGRFYNPEKGVYFLIEENYMLLSTTGYPERGIPLYYGLVRPILVSLIDTSSWDTTVLEHGRLVYWLSQLHWGSAFYTPRLPITTLYAHRICSFLSRGLSPPEEYYSRLWFL